jgi:hypothetical protein
VRGSLSFSKNLENPIGAILYFITMPSLQRFELHHYYRITTHSQSDRRVTASPRSSGMLKIPEDFSKSIGRNGKFALTC